MCGAVTSQRVANFHVGARAEAKVVVVVVVVVVVDVDVDGGAQAVFMGRSSR